MKNIRSSEKRIETIDIIKGISLCGILFINIPYYLYSENFGSPGVYKYTILNIFLENSYIILIAGKFVAIFSFLFGNNIYLFISRTEAKKGKYIICYLRRSAMLYLFSCLHLYLWNTDIIGGYVLMGLFILPLYKCSSQIILRIIWSIITIVIIGNLLLISGIKIPFLNMILGFGFHLIPFISGFYLAKIHFFYKTFSFIKPLKTLLLVLMPITLFIIGFYIYFLYIDINKNSLNFYLKYTNYIVAAFYLVSMILLLNQPRIIKKMQLFGTLGKMSLTNYLTQDQWGAFLLYCFFPFKAILPIHIPFFMVAITSIQFLIGRYWLMYFKQGPLEWILARVSYWEL